MSDGVEGDGFEPSKAEPSDLQSDPFSHSGNLPLRDVTLIVKEYVAGTKDGT